MCHDSLRRDYLLVPSYGTNSRTKNRPRQCMLVQQSMIVPNRWPAPLEYYRSSHVMYSADSCLLTSGRQSSQGSPVEDRGVDEVLFLGNLSIHCLVLYGWSRIVVGEAGTCPKIAPWR